MLAAGNTAVFLKDGQSVTIPNKDLFVLGKNLDSVPPMGALEWYPNRDSVKFVEHHAIPECKTHIRGTYRFVRTPRVSGGGGGV